MGTESGVNALNKIELQNVSKAYGKNAPVIENLNLQIKDGSFTVLLGPSGCGKSTILRMIAGLEKETAGEIMIDGRSVRNVEPGDRKIAMVFQNYALYPTMTVRGNIEFGLKNMGVPKEEREERIREIAGMVGLTEFLGRKPGHLSGGQRQRVALARAMVKKPSVFLMDEPLSNLDAKLRTQIRTDLIELYQELKTTFVYVTHDQIEAMSMGTDIVLLDMGRIMQQGSPREIYQRPQNLFAARFIGAPPMNVVDAAAAHVSDVAVPEGSYTLGFRPERARLLPEGQPVPGRHIGIGGRVVTCEMLGDQVLYKVDTRLGVLHVKNFTSQTVNLGYAIVTVSLDDLLFFDLEERLIGGGRAEEKSACCG
jgi:sn-glycerol 3-phosphate transport system ATP-binding protein